MMSISVNQVTQVNQVTLGGFCHSVSSLKRGDLTCTCYKQLLFDLPEPPKGDVPITDGTSSTQPIDWGLIIGCIAAAVVVIAIAIYIVYRWIHKPVPEPKVDDSKLVTKTESDNPGIENNGFVHDQNGSVVNKVDESKDSLEKENDTRAKHEIEKTKGGKTTKSVEDERPGKADNTIPDPNKKESSCVYEIQDDEVKKTDIVAPPTGVAEYAEINSSTDIAQSEKNHANKADDEDYVVSITPEADVVKVASILKRPQANTGNDALLKV
ncbi:uncharacterized protein LOC144450479 [Glandiceps talaboti]